MDRTEPGAKSKPGGSGCTKICFCTLSNCSRRLAKFQSMRGQHRRRYCCYYLICLLIFPYVLLRVGKYYHVIDKNFPANVKRSVPVLNRISINFNAPQEADVVETTTDDTHTSSLRSTEAESQQNWNGQTSNVLVSPNGDAVRPSDENQTTTPSNQVLPNPQNPQEVADSVNKGLIFRYDSKSVLIVPKIKALDKLVIGVVTAPSNVHQRMEIRKSWKKDAANSSYGITVLFFIGKSSYNATAESEVRGEASIYEDMVQLDFEDTYRNLTLKTYGMIRWFSLYTINAKYLLKVDDDTYVNIPRLEALMPTLEGPGNEPKLLIGVGRMRVQPVRDIAAGVKYIAESDYPEPTYPPYLSGGGYLMSREAAIRINNACRYVKSSLPVEDVLITGLCANAAGVRRRHNPSFRAARRPPGHHCVYYNRVLVAQVKVSMVAIGYVLKSPKLASFDCSRHY